MVLGGEDDNFVELGEVREEIVHTRAFGCSPAVFALGEL